MATPADSRKHSKDPLETRSAIRLSLAACALVVATSAAEPTVQAATGVAAAATAAVSQVSESVILKKIRAYCSKSWQNAGISHQEWADCTQQVFSRLLERVDRDSLLTAIEDAESPERRELNRAIWATSQRSRREKKYSSLEFAESPSEKHDPWPAKMESLNQVRNAVGSEDARLSPTQREIVSRWSDGESISAIAESLQLSPARISDEKYKAIQKLRQHFGSDAIV
jgi:DNA-binding CsgD family transcriptional regulator